MKTPNLYSTVSLAMGLFFSGASHAGEGALALTTDPKEADIYVDGQLKANLTPMVLKLPEGKHRLEVKKMDKQTQQQDVLISDGIVISLKITMVEIPPPPPSPKIDLLNLLNPQRDEFETPQEFQLRRQLWLKDFHQATQSYDSRYQAGVAVLSKAGYNLDTGEFPLTFFWAEWVKQLNTLVPLSLPNNSYIVAVRDDAKTLWDEGQQKPVYLYFRLVDDKLTVDNVILVGLAKPWPIFFEQPEPTVSPPPVQKKSLIDRAVNKARKIWRKVW